MELTYYGVLDLPKEPKKPWVVFNFDWRDATMIMKKSFLTEESAKEYVKELTDEESEGKCLTYGYLNRIHFARVANKVINLP